MAARRKCSMRSRALWPDFSAPARPRPGRHVRCIRRGSPRALFQAIKCRPYGRGEAQHNGERLHRTNAWQIVRRRAKAAGIATEVCNNTFRGTGITAYLENGGTLEKARQMAAHASTRTTQLYDRREDRVTLDEVVKINIRG
jgi:integrase